MTGVTSIEELLERIQVLLCQYSAEDKQSGRLTVEQADDEYQRLRIEQESHIKNEDFKHDQSHEEMDLEYEQERLKGIRLRTEIRCLIDMIQEFVEI